MDGTDIGKRCQEYLEEKLNKIIYDDYDFVFWDHKKKLVVKNSDDFHHIAQAFDIQEIRRRGCDFDYYIKIPRLESKIPDTWIVCLDEENIKNSADFLSVYGEIYTIN